jgi:sulfite exporter TauE/SafE
VYTAAHEEPGDHSTPAGRGVSEPGVLALLLGSALTVAAVHTLIGIDHTLPFVALARAHGWPLRKLLWITALCGLGHVLSSVLLGLAGIGLGAALSRLQGFQALRGSVAAWLLIGFGCLLALRSLLRAPRGLRHSHAHVHADGVVHHHPHAHDHAEHVHPHAPPAQASLTVYALFVIFVLGPCEPLLPLMLASAALHDARLVALVSLVFSAATVATMLVLVTAGHLGLARLRLPLPLLERHADLLAGLAIAASGIAIRVFGI